MRKILLLIPFTFLIVTISSAQNNSFKPAEIWKDNNGVHFNAHGGGVMYFNNTYYWYGEHKIEGEKGNSAQVGVHVYSSKDLYNWNDEGIALQVDTRDETSKIAKGCLIERPKVIYNESTKKFVMWFHLELKGEGYDNALSGVAVADNPVGPFEFLKAVRPDKGTWPVNVQDFHKRPVADLVKAHYCGGKSCLPTHVDSLNLLGRDFEKGQMARDMNLFVDDNGKAYHLYSSEENSTMHISQLTDDYLSHAGNYVRLFAGRYMEGMTICKTSDGKYYIIASDCTGWNPNAARSAVADDIFGPWKELGNPAQGEGANTTFDSQSTYILPVQGKKDAFIFMGDRWRPENAIDGRYVWLPIDFEDDKPVIRWQDEWDLSHFEKAKPY